MTGFLWGHAVQGLDEGFPVALLVPFVVLLVVAPLCLARALYVYPRWWIEVLLRVRMSVMTGQTRQHRLSATPPGEVVARAMDADRFVRYADRWVDLVNGLVIAGVTALLSRSWLAGAVLLAVMVVSAAASTLGRPIAGRSATSSSAARAGSARAGLGARFGALGQARRPDAPGARAPARGRCGPRAGRGLRAPRAGRARRRAARHDPARCRRGLGWAPHRDVGPRDRAPGRERGQRLRLVRRRCRGRRDGGARHPFVAARDGPLRGGGDLMDLPRGVDLLTGEAPTPAPGPRQTLELLELAG
ncbi:hypothetical protein NKG05_04430 [Oerskovia sp. M15]